VIENPFTSIAVLRIMSNEVESLIMRRSSPTERNLMRMNTWEFDVLSLTNEELLAMPSSLFHMYGLFDEFSIEADKFSSFLLAVSGAYQNLPYHNFRHGCDVLHSTYLFTLKSHLHKAFSKLEILSLLLSAIGHDIGHLGLNNAYLVKTKHEVAIRYNDKSPLENMHCALFFAVLMTKDYNVLAGLTDGQWRSTRKCIISCILGTDMAFHGQQLAELKAFHETNGPLLKSFVTGETDEVPSVLLQEEHRLFMMVISLHCSDISNPFKTFDIASKWAEFIVEEFYAQGDREKAEGNTSS
jgi:3'5'-cyclic nucleotide phosphodiesterase